MINPFINCESPCSLATTKISFNDNPHLRDKKRKNSPLLKSRDAIIVDTGKLKNIPDMMERMSEIVEKKIKEKYGS